MILQEYYNSLTFVALNELLKQHSQKKIEKIRESHKIIGGRFIILDSVNVQKVIKFYQSEPNSFILLDKNTKEPNVKMYYPLV
ncbi:MAG: hypothetical protein DRG78_14965 [Epsilonproteobacteria bacterium]|nr:MAG: hypothetical protein DRG78_14965 [Campylobacterota bacterium]